MKKAAIITTLILTGLFCQAGKAQIAIRNSRSGASFSKEQKINERLFFKGIQRKEKRSGIRQKKTFKPKLSADLLVGSGIHLFTISDISFLPTMNIGTRIKAGITISI